MTTINDRIGSQNVIRVLSNASAPPTRLNNLSDVNSLRKDEDGLILVWDVTTEKFVLTDEIDGANLIVTGISSFSNLTDSTSSTTGAVKISGGVGIFKNLNVGGDLQITGVSTFNNVARFTGSYVTVDKTLLAKDLYASDQVIGVSTGILGSLKIWEGNSQVEVISSSRELKNIISLDAVTTSTIESAISNAPNTFTDLNVTGISTFIGIATFASGIVVDAGISTFNNAIDAKSGILASILSVTGEVSSGTIKAGNLTAGRVVYVGPQGLLQDNANLTFDGGLLSLSGDLNVSGITTFNDDVIFTGANSNARWDYSTSDLILFDNTRLEFGSNKDFEIWHGGAHTYLKNTGGDLRIRGDKILLKKEDDTERYLEATANQDVKLFFNDVEKMATTVDGVNVLGTLTAQLIDGGSY